MRQLLNPYHNVRPDHPLIVRETRRLRWLKRAGTPGHYSVQIILLVISIVLVLYVGWLVFYVPPSWSPDQWLSYKTSDFLIRLGGLSLLAIVPLDYVSITASLNSISGEITNRTWDLLRLTALRQGELVLAKHAITQLRAWRTTIWVIGLRIAVSLVAATSFVARFLDASNPAVSDSMGLGFLYFCFSFVPLAALVGIFVLEPLWRMRAITSLGMVISAWVRDSAFATLLAIAMVLVLWFVQALVLFTLIAGLSAVMVVLFSVIGLCAPFILPLIVFPTVYGFYSIVKTWGLRQVTRRLFTLT